MMRLPARCLGWRYIFKCSQHPKSIIMLLTLSSESHTEMQRPLTCKALSCPCGGALGCNFCWRAANLCCCGKSRKKKRQQGGNTSPAPSFFSFFSLPFVGRKQWRMYRGVIRLLSEELPALFPGQLIVERSRGLILIGLIWSGREEEVEGPEGERRGRREKTQITSLWKSCALPHTPGSIFSLQILETGAFQHRSILATTSACWLLQAQSGEKKMKESAGRSESD